MVIFKRLFSKNKVLWPVILVLFLLLAIGLTGSFLLKEKQTLLVKKTELVNLKKDLELLDKILIEQKSSEEKVKAVAKTLPVTFEEVAFAVSQIEKVAAESGQTLDIKIEETALPEPNDLLSLKMTLKTEGSYDTFSRMLNTLAHLPYHTRVDALKIEQTGKLSTVTNLRFYLSKEGAE